MQLRDRTWQVEPIGRPSLPFQADCLLQNSTYRVSQPRGSEPELFVAGDGDQIAQSYRLGESHGYALFRRRKALPKVRRAGMRLSGRLERVGERIVFRCRRCVTGGIVSKWVGKVGTIF